MELQTIAMILYLLTSFAIIGLILLQQGKGAEAGASFGAGSSATVFGSSGSGNFFSRLTAVLATVFFVLAFGLTLLAKQRLGVQDVPALVEQPLLEQAQDSDIPSLDSEPVTEGDIPTLDAEPVTEGDIPTLESGSVDIPAEADVDVPAVEAEVPSTKE